MDDADGDLPSLADMIEAVRRELTLAQAAGEGQPVHEKPDVIAERDESALPERPVQAEGLEVHEVDDGLVVYQAQPECVHHLNNTAAIVFELCNGDNTVPEISEQLAEAFGLSEPPRQLTEDCIADLCSRGVVN